MSKAHAAQILRQYRPSEIVGAYYDDDEGLRDALARLIPGFEYPDWSGATFAKILAEFAR